MTKLERAGHESGVASVLRRSQALQRDCAFESVHADTTEEEQVLRAASVLIDEARALVARSVLLRRANRDLIERAIRKDSVVKR